MFEAITLDLIGTIIAALLTIMVLSYLVGDNPLFRIATHIFIGVAAGYAGVVAWDSVSLPMALLVGVGAAVVVGGAITGTLIPQSRAAMLSLSLTEGSADLGATGFEHTANVLILLMGTISTLIYFRFSSPPSENAPQPITGVMNSLRTVGRVFIAITFGAMYAGALMAAIIALAERFNFLGRVITDLLGN